MKRLKFEFIIVFLGIALSIISCAEPYTSYNAILINNTTVDIKMIPYKSGIAIADNIDSVLSGDSLIIGLGVDRGKVNRGGFDSDLLSNMDSLIVIYNNIYQVVHYSVNPEVRSEKSISIESDRNVFNYLNYDYSYSDKSNNVRNALYRFSYIESDYEFAKD